MKKIVLIPKDKRCPIGDINASWCTIKYNKFLYKEHRNFHNKS